MMVLAIPAITIGIYLLVNLVLPQLPVDVQVRTYIIQPALWGLLILFTRFLPDYRPSGKRSRYQSYVRLAFIIGGLQIILYGIGGLFSGFGRNPASSTLIGILGNLVFIGVMLAAQELGRAFLVTRFGKKYSFLGILLVGLLYTAIGIPLSQYKGFQMNMSAVNQIMSSWLPLLAENLLASMLVMIAGARSSLAYRGLLAAFWWFCPVLPDINWIFKGLFGIAIPVLGMMLVNTSYTQQTSRDNSRRYTLNKSLPGGWIAVSLAVVVMVWFAVGVFPIQPKLVGSGSMTPTLRTGDIAIVARMPASRVKLGDIIQYRKDDHTDILHRVIAINQTENGRTYTTRGDANSAADLDPVIPENVVGKVVFNIPKLGLISVIIKGIFSGGV